MTRHTLFSDRNKHLSPWNQFNKNARAISSSWGNQITPPGLNFTGLCPSEGPLTFVGRYVDAFWRARTHLPGEKLETKHAVPKGLCSEGCWLRKSSYCLWGPLPSVQKLLIQRNPRLLRRPKPESRVSPERQEQAGLELLREFEAPKESTDPTQPSIFAVLKRYQLGILSEMKSSQRGYQSRLDYLWLSDIGFSVCLLHSEYSESYGHFFPYFVNISWLVGCVINKHCK